MMKKIILVLAVFSLDLCAADQALASLKGLEGWGKGGVEGLWSGDGDLHLDPDRPLPSRRRLSCQETDQPGGT